ncbi:nucleotide-binding protein [Betaproteobacteria bacterium]|nr:nucleotide-binding protein [Betaproteobacteria bacterium]GHU15987.1 nucleotide-binding protein [Betaproteobacteria bacterium]GHU29800.1 nucleotide-binding protein [Betaproteobacteria bacterium]
MQFVLISGLSGSGKSIALKALEDSAYYVVDNLPASLLPQLVATLHGGGYQRVAVAIDVRSGGSHATLPQQIEPLRKLVDDLRFIFLEARDDILLARFSETRRRHPLAEGEISLSEAIQRERETLEKISMLAYRIDTSDLQPNMLRAWVREFIEAKAGSNLSLSFQSFGFKYGIPLDADFVFDVRCLPNPYYNPALRNLTGKDAPVAAYLEQSADVIRMVEDIRQFITNWLPGFIHDDRNYLAVAIGCTGGQHRSVYVAERLATGFRDLMPVLVRHRSAARRASDQH